MFRHGIGESRLPFLLIGTVEDEQTLARDDGGDVRERKDAGRARDDVRPVRRAPIAFDARGTAIGLLFRKEVEVLKFLSL